MRESDKKKLLPLWPGAKPCVKCGFCCKRTSCGAGEWDEEKKQCKELVDNGDGTYNCGAIERIISDPRGYWKVAPAFGAGCCSSLNQDRQDIIRKSQRRVNHG